MATARSFSNVSYSKIKASKRRSQSSPSVIERKYVMRSEEIVRSWKDETYRLNLSDKEQALLPDNPAGVIELTDAELCGVEGGTWITIDTCGTWCMPTLTCLICPVENNV
jgi:mersacidin/lichenicidin family type 2 lantibiotic